ncbi:MAG: metallophosphoesterase, partial [Planctomycetaceae bacterium]|nr:metallophosphoesterase [Planctomycetaceae bacterium]
LLMSHTPDNFDFARQQSVDLMLAGHTHGGQVQLPLIGPVYSPSKYGCKYSSGTFFEAPTLMHVSRGLAGIHPLRWRCPPEITRLTLRRG